MVAKKQKYYRPTSASVDSPPSENKLIDRDNQKTTFQMIQENRPEMVQAL